MIALKVLVISRSAGLVRDLQAAAGPGFAFTHHTSAADVEEYVELKGPFDLLVAGPVFDFRAGMERLRRVKVAYPELPVLLALSTPLRSPVPDIVRVGAADLVELPAERRHLAAALRRSLESPNRMSGAEEKAEEEAGLGEVISVASPSGGCGKTFYSTNLAYYLTRHSGRRVCLVDLDLQFGEVMSALRLKPRLTMIDAIDAAEETGDLEPNLEECLIPHESGFWVLPAPLHPAEADRITLPDVTRVIAALRHRFDYVIVDTSAQLSEVTLTALEQSTALICMATVDVPSIRNMRVFLDTLERLRVPTDQVAVVLNKVEADIGIRLDEVDEALHHKVVAVLPYAREVSRSINRGQPVLVFDAKADISRKLTASMQSRLLGGDGLTEAPPNGQVTEPAARRSRRLLSVFARGAEGR